MKIVVDRSACSGHALCNGAGPDVYELDDNGYCAISELDVPSALEDQARAGADACPERAIVLSE